MAVAEAYPDLKADDNFRQLQDELSEIEEQLQSARRYYNATVRDLNTRIQSFPDVLFARPLGFAEAEFYRTPMPRSSRRRRSSSARRRPEAMIRLGRCWRCSWPRWRSSRPGRPGAVRGRWRAHPLLAQRHRRPRGRRARCDRDDPRQRSKATRSTTASTATSRPPTSATAAGSGSGSTCRASSATASPSLTTPREPETASASGSATPRSMSRTASTLTSSATRTTRQLGFFDGYDELTGTSPATAGPSRSTAPRRISGCPRPCAFGPERAFYTGPQGATAQRRRGGLGAAGRDR